MNKTIKVTYQANYKVKQGRKLVDKVSQITEEHTDEASARLRGLALNWTIVKIERL